MLQRRSGKQPGGKTLFRYADNEDRKTEMFR